LTRRITQDVFMLHICGNCPVNISTVRCRKKIKLMHLKAPYVLNMASRAGNRMTTLRPNACADKSYQSYNHVVSKARSSNRHTEHHSSCLCSQRNPMPPSLFGEFNESTQIARTDSALTRQLLLHYKTAALLDLRRAGLEHPAGAHRLRPESLADPGRDFGRRQRQCAGRLGR
jgi:hypothetical protein